MRTLASAISAVVPYDLFTLLIVDWNDNLVRRAYSTDEQNYPSGGVKRLMDSLWADQVIHHSQVFFAATPDQMAEAFSDHADLSALGLHKALNVPIRDAGKTCCSLNLLRRDEAFSANEGYEVLRVFGRWSSKQLQRQ
ncbi:hypothetical protein C7W93_17620 [Glaciimonas sp. PCH181]|nr:hypothetical protein C7W93_17620 [Glaciimonas sp. PCH181]